MAGSGLLGATVVKFSYSTQTLWRQQTENSQQQK